MNFQDLDLNSRLKANLSDMVDSGKLPHAIIIDGGKVDTRVKLARLLAASLVCRAEEGRPCGHCAACVKAFGVIQDRKKKPGEKVLAQTLRHPDIFEIEKDKNRTQFSVEIIRQVRKEAYILPNEAKAKVYILREAHLMNAAAQNALLTILEEPPSYICFILECTSRSVLLPTVLSRATCFSVGQIELGDGTKAKKSALALKTAQELALAITAPYEYELLKKTAVFEKSKNLIELCLPELELIVRDALILQAGKGGIEPVSSSPDAAAVLARDLPQAKLLKLIEEIRLLLEATKRNANKNLLITRICSRLRV